MTETIAPYYNVSLKRRENRDRYDKVYRVWGDGEVRTMTCVWTLPNDIVGGTLIKCMRLPRYVRVLQAIISGTQAAPRGLQCSMTDGRKSYIIRDNISTATKHWSYMGGVYTKAVINNEAALANEKSDDPTTIHSERIDNISAIGMRTGGRDYDVVIGPSKGDLAWQKGSTFSLIVMYSNDVLQE